MESSLLPEIEQVIWSRLLLGLYDQNNYFPNDERNYQEKKYIQHCITNIVSIAPLLSFQRMANQILYPQSTLHRKSGYQIKQIIEYQWGAGNYLCFDTLLNIFGIERNFQEMMATLDWTLIGPLAITTLIKIDAWYLFQYLLLHGGIGIMQNISSQLPYIAAEGSLEFFYRYLLHRPFDINQLEMGQNCLTKAIRCRNVPIIRFILSLIMKLYRILEPITDSQYHNYFNDESYQPTMEMYQLDLKVNNLFAIDGFSHALSKLDLAQSFSYVERTSSLYHHFMRLPHVITFLPAREMGGERNV